MITRTLFGKILRTSSVCYICLFQFYLLKIINPLWTKKLGLNNIIPSVGQVATTSCTKNILECEREERTEECVSLLLNCYVWTWE